MALQKGLGREYFLSLKLDDPERKNLIAEEADSILQNELWTTDIAEKVRPEFFCEDPFLTIFRAHQATWAKHNDLAELMRVLRQHKAGLSNINKIVCFSLGSPQSVSVNFKYGKSTVWKYCCQYATALELAKLFKEFNGGEEVQVFAQDPNITPMEIDAFPKVGITIVNSRLHKGFGLIDPNTFVFSIAHRTSNLEKIVMATSQPAGMLFTPNYRHNEINKALQAVREEYNEVPCDALTNRWAIFEGQQVDHPLGRDTKLFILKNKMTSARKRRMAESLPGIRERDKLVRRKVPGVASWHLLCLVLTQPDAQKGAMMRLNLKDIPGEHISRCHAPKNQCHRCRRDFNNANELAKHQRNINACPLILDAPLSQFITADQIVQLKRRAGKRANISSEDKWCSVYKILFPGDSFVPSPYRDEPCVACISKASSQLLENYRQHQVQALVPLVERELAAISHSHGMSDGLRAHITDLFSRLSVKVLNEFQEKHASNIPENYTFPSGCEMEPRNSTCEAATSPPSAITLAFSQLQDFLGYDAVPDMMLNGYDLMEEKLE